MNKSTIRNLTTKENKINVLQLDPVVGCLSRYAGFPSLRPTVVKSIIPLECSNRHGSAIMNDDKRAKTTVKIGNRVIIMTRICSKIKCIKTK